MSRRLSQRGSPARSLGRRFCESSTDWTTIYQSLMATKRSRAAMKPVRDNSTVNARKTTGSGIESGNMNGNSKIAQYVLSQVLKD